LRRHPASCKRRGSAAQRPVGPRACGRRHGRARAAAGLRRPPPAARRPL